MNDSWVLWTLYLKWTMLTFDHHKLFHLPNSRLQSLSVAQQNNTTWYQGLVSSIVKIEISSNYDISRGCLCQSWWCCCCWKSVVVLAELCMMTILKVIDQIEILNHSFINFKADEEAGVRHKRGVLQGVLLLSAFRGVAIPQLPQIPGIPIIGWTQLLQHLFNERISIKTTLSQDTLIVEPLILNSYHALSLLLHCFLHLQSQFWSVKMMIRCRLA